MAGKAKTYPKDSQFEAWFLAKEAGSYTIRRFVNRYGDGKRIGSQRLPLQKFRHLLDNPKELADFVVRLNGKDPVAERAKGAAEFRHAYVSEELLTDYVQNYLLQQIPTKKDAGTMYRYLRSYALRFFLLKMKVMNPIDWHRNQNVWGKYLLNREEDKLDDALRLFEPNELRSAKVLRQIVNEMNRFMRYLHLKRPDEVPQLTFAPLTRAALKEHEGRRRLYSQVHQSAYIDDRSWELLKHSLEQLAAPWRFAVYLAYYYGLRRNEALGLQSADVRRAYLSCERQLEKFELDQPKFRPLKNRTPRKVPHWFVEPATVHAWIEGMRAHPIHPDTLSRHWLDYTKDRYQFHDLRRTFITNALRKGVAPEDVRLGVGHSNIHTTYKFYVMDARQLDDEVWVPSAKGVA
jgi:integrase